MNQLPLFDAKRSKAHKERGMASAASHQRELLGIARAIALTLALNGDGTCTMDDVKRQMLKMGLDPRELGNAAGAVFKTDEWEFTGERIRSAQVSAHNREIKGGE